VAEGDFLLKFVERGGAEVDKQQYLSWRNTGLAYRLATGEGIAYWETDKVVAKLTERK
jgi:hypothetical protein